MSWLFNLVEFLMDCCNLKCIKLFFFFCSKTSKYANAEAYVSPNKSPSVIERNVMFYGLSKKMCPAKALGFKGNGR